MLEIDASTAIPDEEFLVSFTRSSGPGGQNVNKVATRVSLALDVQGSSAFTAEQKARIIEQLASRMTKEGVLRVDSQKTRSQARNLEDAREKVAALIRGALAEVAERRPTRPSRGARRRRLEGKRKRSEIKEKRRPVRRDD